MSDDSAAASAATGGPAASGHGDEDHKHRNRLIAEVLLILVVTVGITLVPAPDGVDGRGMLMLGIFVGTIIGLVLQPLPTPSVAIIGLSVAMITGAMDASDEALTGFGNSTVWLIVAAFFIAEGFLLTGLGRRIALLFVRRLGKSSLGLAYGMAITDLILAPATPSNTARNGGVLYPIVASLSAVNGSTPESDASRRKLGAYLSFTSVHVNTITSAMFITAMAGNPIAQDAAAKAGVDISWAKWALTAAVPGVICLAVVPWVMSKLYPPTIHKTPDAPAKAKDDLAEMGPMSSPEKIMGGTFVLLLALWVLGKALDINATAAAFVGVSILLVTGVLTWKDLAENASAWSTLLFFGVLIGMANQLEALGVIAWAGDAVADAVAGMSWPVAFTILCLVYFYAHYLFASNTAHVVAMYAVFLGAAIGAGTPPMVAALSLGYIGNLFGALTHYASGPAAVIYGSGFVKVTEWFRISFVMSVIVIALWASTSMLWMKVLGDW